MNAKLREQGKKEEKRRLKEFVENAYRCDPRVIAHKEAQRAERCAQNTHVPAIMADSIYLILLPGTFWPGRAQRA